jgi:Flp pilus assembly pilin Flp
MDWEMLPSGLNTQEFSMRANIKNRLRQFHADDRGAMSVEMMLILAIVAIPVLVILYIFGKKIIGWFNDQNTALDSQHG